MSDPENKLTSLPPVYGIQIRYSADTVAIDVVPRMAAAMKVATMLITAAFVVTMSAFLWLQHQSLVSDECRGLLAFPEPTQLPLPTPEALLRGALRVAPSAQNAEPEGNRVLSVLVAPGSLVASGETLALLGATASQATPLAAPWPAKVSQVLLATGPLPTDAGPAFVLIPTTTMLFRCQVLETILPRLRPGGSAQVAVRAFPGETFRGIVTEIGEQGRFDEGQQASFFPVTVSLDVAPGRLKSGMTGTARF